MEVFKALIQIFLVFLSINVVLCGLLWRITRYKPFIVLTLHWLIELVTFFVSGAVAQEAPYIRLMSVQYLAFIGVYTLAWVLADLLQINMPFWKFTLIPLVTMFAITILHWLNVRPEILAIPSVICSAFCLFFVTYHAIRYHRDKLSYSLWAIVAIFILYGFHFFDFAYFYVRFDLLVIGFTIALGFHLAISIITPATLIEQIAKEKSRIETQIIYQRRLAQTSKMAALGQMASGVALEINSPLTKIVQTLDEMEVSLVHVPSENGIAPLLSICRKTVTRMFHIVNSLLVFSGERKMNDPVRVDIEPLVKESLSIFEDIRNKNKIDIQVEWSKRPLRFKGHPTQISQVLLNLLSNAYDEIENNAEKWIRVQIKELATQIEISVTDSGKGIKPEIQEKIFQPFFSNKTIGKGTGLGLSICKGIVEGHGGQLFLDGKSKNTRFVFVINKES